MTLSSIIFANDFSSIERDAKLGNAEAQFDLGTLYDIGESVKQDFKKAATWYLLAAEQGEVAAQYNLAIMYDMGEGVEKDITKAYAWMAAAEMFGYQGARESSKDFYNKMNDEQKTKGDALVLEIVNKIIAMKKQANNKKVK